MDNIFNNINDILDSKGKYNNFLTNKPYSDQYIEMAKKWSKLPLYNTMEAVSDFFNLLDSKQVILLISGTGSGKTVIVPKFVLKYFRTMNIKGKIAVTNPKILTTIYNAEYGAKTLDVDIGSVVGYRFKGSPEEAYSDQSQLLYITDGLLLARILAGDKLLEEYNAIIIDEAHERHIQIDLLLKFLKEVIYHRPDFKVIIMSATISAEVFREYFNIPDIKYGEIEISGKSNYDIKQNWMDNNIVHKNNYLPFAVKKCVEIINKKEEGDIIVFVPMTNDASMGCNMLKTECPKLVTKDIATDCDTLFCVQVYAKMKEEDKEFAVSKDLYKKDGKYKRKVIFATNVAESSITFDGLVYVIDSGFEIKSYFEPMENIFILDKLYTSQAQVKQRIGRAGRTQPGVSYHLYTKTLYETFHKYPEPNISTIDITEYIMAFIKYGKTIKNTITIIKDLLTVPSIKQIVCTLYKLSFYKCLKLVKPFNNENEKLEKIEMKDVSWMGIKSIDSINNIMNGTLTTIGSIILKFKSCSVANGMAIILSHYMNCMDMIIKIVAILEVLEGNIDTLFIFDRKNPNDILNEFKKYGVHNSDHLTALNIYNRYYLPYKLKQDSMNPKPIPIIKPIETKPIQKQEVRIIEPIEDFTPPIKRVNIDTKKEYNTTSENTTSDNTSTSRENTTSDNTSTSRENTTSDNTSTSRENKTKSKVESDDDNDDDLFIDSYEEKQDEVDKKIINDESYNSDEKYEDFLGGAMESGLKYINHKKFDIIDKRIEELTLYSYKITKERYTDANQKYDLVTIQPFDEIEDNILFVLKEAFRFNMLEKVNNIYRAKNYLVNTEAPAGYSIFTPNNMDESKLIICNTYNNIFDKKKFNCISAVKD
jgi:pre-mRNA-splicing factor ATP-dependent RNA helicase DHX15/PRP43